jgi:hypothetical protein
VAACVIATAPIQLATAQISINTLLVLTSSSNACLQQQIYELLSNKRCAPLAILQNTAAACVFDQIGGASARFQIQQYPSSSRRSPAAFE